MRERARQFAGVVLPLLTIAVFATVLVLSFRQLSMTQSTLRIELTQNMLWVISRAEAANLRLIEETAWAAQGDASQIHRALDIWFSRTQILLDEPQRGRMTHLGFEDTLARIEAAMAHLEVDLARVLTGDLAALDRVSESLQPLAMQLGRAANRAMTAEWEDIGRQLDQTASGMRQIGLSLAVIAGAGLVLVLSLALTARASNRRAAQLQAERAFSQLLVSAGDRGIVAFDTAGQCTLWNGAMETLFGLRADEALGRSSAEIAGFFATQHIAAMLQDILGGRARVAVDQSVFDRDGGEPHLIDLMGFPLRRDSQIVGAVLIASDVTERHDAQRSLARHRDQLEIEVARRTEELDAALIRERASLDIYRNFAAMISHQFRTPLAVIDSSLQRLMRRGSAVDTVEISERTTRARAAVAQLVRLIESIFDAARFDAGQVTTEAHSVDVAALMTGLVTRAEHDFEPIDIEVRPPEGLILATGDATQLEHILLNLLSNARKYSDPGEKIQVTIEAKAEKVSVIVSNTGDIAPADRPHVFDRYYRGSRVEGVSGIGLGLYMARSLARIQGGDLTLLETAPGTVAFGLTLPRAGADGAQLLEGGSHARA
ncbi:sensor histidine kinase [Paracoccus aminophilus]|uniref:histidine kinase n=1 Tax=Paracoccus aminophilus JCM 7686 TaxID=1367847 RepID=S5XVV4_PARAH|nr:PAS domain-containing sensor histidine kinase [Paracoccus aminophilus]AGT11624.1 two-component system histidine kinase [Paracoccus aminophilus JCM 7686]